MRERPKTFLRRPLSRRRVGTLASVDNQPRRRGLKKKPSTLHARRIFRISRPTESTAPAHSLFGRDPPRRGARCQPYRRPAGDATPASSPCLAATRRRGARRPQRTRPHLATCLPLLSGARDCGAINSQPPRYDPGSPNRARRAEIRLNKPSAQRSTRSRLSQGAAWTPPNASRGLRT